MADRNQKKVMTQRQRAITQVFTSTIREVRQSLDESKMPSAVDVEVQFNQVTISEKGIPLFTEKTSQTAMCIRLATRIVPSS